MKTYRAHIRKEALKFSAAHMTVFPDGSKESIHGHNYRPEVTVELNDITLSKMISFAEFKRAMKMISANWDERLLLAGTCPYLKIIKQDRKETEFSLCGKRYLLPSDEVVVLPIDNITTETLADEYCRLFIEQMSNQLKSKTILSLEVRIDEIDGQGATCRWTP